MTNTFLVSVTGGNVLTSLTTFVSVLVTGGSVFSTVCEIVPMEVAVSMEWATGKTAMPSCAFIYRARARALTLNLVSVFVSGGSVLVSTATRNGEQ